MRKRGVSLTFNTIIIAVIALVVLIVILSIYTNFIRKSAEDIGKPAEAAGLEASDAAWCMAELFKGAKCKEIDSDTCSGDCLPAGLDDNGTKCRLTCKDKTRQKHGIAKNSNDRTFDCKKNDYAQRYCCCT